MAGAVIEIEQTSAPNDGSGALQGTETPRRSVIGTTVRGAAPILKPQPERNQPV